MKKLYALIALIVFLPLFGSVRITLAKDSEHLKFTCLTPADGLPSEDIRTIIQDHLGLMWFGTGAEGVIKYDGYNFTCYDYDSLDPQSLSANFVWNLYEDQDNTLWIGTTGGGLNKFEREAERFVRYQHDPDQSGSLPHNNIKAMYEDSAGTTWVSSNGGLSMFNKEQGTFFTHQHNPDDPNSLSGNSIRTIYEDKETGLLWLGTRRNGITVYDRQKEQFTRYQHNPDDATSLSNDAVNHIYKDSIGNLWISTRNGLNRFEPATKTFIRYSHVPGEPGTLSNPRVEKAYEDTKGRLWFITYGGLNLFDRQTEIFTHYQPDPDVPHGLSSNAFADIYEDNTGTLWFGTLDGGICRLSSEPEKFTAYQLSPGGRESVQAVHLDRSGVLWLGTNEGLYRFQDETLTGYYHDPDDLNSLSDNSILALTEDLQGNLWIGTRTGGLNRFDGHTFIRYTHNPDDENSLGGDSSVCALYGDERGGLWISLHGGGLDYLGGEYFSHYIPYDVEDGRGLYIMSFYGDKNTGTIWLGGKDFIVKLDEDTNTFTPYPLQLDGDPMVETIHRAKSGILWLGTDIGLFGFDPRTEEIIHHYTDKDGLPSNAIKSILEDRKGNLWLGTGHGISKFDPYSKAFRNYDVRDGLQSNDFALRASAKGTQGQLFFGGTGGFTLFYPGRMKDNPHKPPVILTDFMLFNKPVSPGENTPLQEHINIAEHITLTHDQSVFGFEFAALNFERPTKNQYAYKMEGFHENWLYTGSDRRFATFTNLNPGQYTFRVKGSNNDGLWNEAGTALAITITPPWWGTWWLRGAVAAVLLALTFAGYQLRIRSIEQRSRELDRQVAARTQELAESNRQLQIAKDAAEAARKSAETANQAKSVFLANMSHELRTPMNAILGYSELMQRDASLPSEQHKHLDTINRSGKHLLALINDVLEISKIEAGQTSIESTTFDLRTMLFNLERLFDSSMDAKGLQFEIIGIDAVPRYVATDENKLRQMLTNILGNAVKFTEKGGITLRVAVEEGQRTRDKGCGTTDEGMRLKVEVEDTGVGIAEDELDKVFAYFEQTASGWTKKSGTGLGLALSRDFARMLGGDITVASKEGKGSTFYLNIDIQKSSKSSIKEKISEPRVIGLAPGQEAPRVLVAEDVEASRTLIVKILESVGFEVQAAVNGKEAVEKCNQWQPDVVLMDIRMPVMDGLEATQCIKKTDAGQSTIVAALTAHALEEEREQILAAGCDDFVRKPFREQEIFEVMAKHLGLKYVYEDKLEQAVPVEPEVELSPVQLAALPADLLSRLHDAVVELSVDRILSLIEPIKTIDAHMARVLETSAKKFALSPLLDLLEKIEQPKQEESHD